MCPDVIAKAERVTHWYKWHIIKCHNLISPCCASLIFRTHQFYESVINWTLHQTESSQSFSNQYSYWEWNVCISFTVTGVSATQTTEWGHYSKYGKDSESVILQLLVLEKHFKCTVCIQAMYNYISQSDFHWRNNSGGSKQQQKWVREQKTDCELLFSWHVSL